MIRLAIEIVTPLTPDDKDLLSGIALMTLAIANRELAAQGFPEAFPPEEGTQPEEAAEVKPEEEAQPEICATVSEDNASICLGHKGHRGRHRFRPIPAVNEAITERLAAAN